MAVDIAAEEALEGDSGGESDPGAAPRPWCFRCGRSEKVCVCDALPEGAPFETETEVVVLVHPKEVKRKCGTLPLLRACLRGLRVVEGSSFPEPEDDPTLHAQLAAEAPGRGARRCALVCPGQGAKPPEDFRDSALGEDGKPLPLTLILIDGTWNQAKSMIRKSKWLQEIPRVVLSPTTGHSGYHFRQQPQEGCLSTLEAVGEALAVLEGDHGKLVQAGLLNVFSAMVVCQVAFIPDDEIVDKNAPGGREAYRQCVIESTARKIVDRDALPVLCICRWGVRVDAGVRRRMHVERVLRRLSMPEAEELCYDLSRERVRGSKLFVQKQEKLPEGSVYDCSPGDSHA